MENCVEQEKSQMSMNRKNELFSNFSMFRMLSGGSEELVAVAKGRKFSPKVLQKIIIIRVESSTADDRMKSFGIFGSYSSVMSSVMIFQIFRLTI